MDNNRNELLSVEEMRKKYGLVAENRQYIKLDKEKVPVALRHLIPYAELWGVSDDLIRQDMINKAPIEAVEELIGIVKDHADLLDEWLAGPESENLNNLSDEYLAFSAMRMAADGF